MWSLLGVLCVGVVGTALPVNFQFNVSPQVQVAQGFVVGTEAADGEYFEFHGIPYADTTTGSHRFKAPLAPPSFTDVFNANRRNVKCIHPSGARFEGTEDCLVVDIYTPSLDNTRSLSVMVWVKGNEFTTFDDNNFSFKNIVEKDVIVVSLNYRQSIFGFLCLGTETAPGNAGLKDIIAGLKWVKQNIANFGGNPDDITLFGHGSGAAAVDLVTLSPMAEGLVQKAISQSGSALAPWAVSRDNLASAIQVANALGHTNFETIEELSEVFTGVSASALMAVISEIELTDNSLVFAPCVERSIPDEEPFLLDTPFEIVNEGKFLQIPFMIGFVDKEGTIRSEEIETSNWLNQMDESFSDFLQPDLEFSNDEVRDEIAIQVRAFYFENNLITDSVQPSIAYHGDTMILVSAIREARLRTASSSTTPLFLYQFSYKGTLGKPLVGPIEVDGAAHSEELAYLFHGTPLISEPEEIPDSDLTVGDILVERWTNFAKNGNPVSETSSVVWQPFTVDNPFYYQILDQEVMSSVDNTHSEVLSFWNAIYEEHFLDAQSNWEINIRDDDEDDVDDADPTPAPDGDGDDDDDDDEDDEDQEVTTPVPDSASTAVGYTFLIISAFALLDKLHSELILS